MLSQQISRCHLRIPRGSKEEAKKKTPGKKCEQRPGRDGICMAGRLAASLEGDSSQRLPRNARLCTSGNYVLAGWLDGLDGFNYGLV